MNGSKNIDDRIYLINNLDKIIFNSEWSKSQFIKNLPEMYTFQVNLKSLNNPSIKKI